MHVRFGSLRAGENGRHIIGLGHGITRCLGTGSIMEASYANTSGETEVPEGHLACTFFLNVSTLLTQETF